MNNNNNKPSKVSQLFDKYLKLDESTCKNDSSDNFATLFNNIEKSNVNDIEKKVEVSDRSNYSKKVIGENIGNNNPKQSSSETLSREVSKNMIKNIERAKLALSYNNGRASDIQKVKVVHEESDNMLKVIAFCDIVKGLLNMSVHRRLLMWNYSVYGADNNNLTNKLDITSRRVLGRALDVLERNIMEKELRRCLSKLRLYK